MNAKIKRKIVASTLLCTMCAYTLPVCAFTKDETVYSKMNHQGKNYQTLVSTRIENNKEETTIEDITDLWNIENTNGEEEFTKQGNSLIWKTEGEDIYYQGESQKDLPIKCEVKYELDGKESKPEEILGKAGEVKITIQYINKEEHLVNINGKEEKIYTPFIAVCGTILPNDTNKNIKISNGKIMNDGSKTWVLGIAMPGLQESLVVDQTEVEIPNKVEISMDASDFELGNIITFVTPKVLEENDLKFFDKLDDIYHKVNTLEVASKQIQEGSMALAKGTKQLASGTKELKEGTNIAYQGAKQIETEVTKATKQVTNDKSDGLDQKTLDKIGEQAKQAANLSEQQKKQIGKQAQSLAKQNIQNQKAVIAQKAENEVKNLKLTRSTKTRNSQKCRSRFKIEC